MPRYDFTTRRLYVAGPLAAIQPVKLDRKQSNYLLSVLRHKQGDKILLFNGRDGEWLADIVVQGRKDVLLVPETRTRKQPEPGRLRFLFAPLKKSRMDYMVQKAVEMGASQIQPVITEFTQFSKVNPEKIKTSIIEAAQQCGIISLPEYLESARLAGMLENWPADTCLIYCDEGEESQNPLAPLNGLEPGPMAVLIGPEGGFSEEERQLLRSKPFVTAIPLGPRVLRADTAAVAALAVVQATIGDWH